MGGALGYTGGLQALIQPVHTIVTLDHFVGCRIKLRDSPRAGTGTGHTTDAFHRCSVFWHTARLLWQIYKSGALDQTSVPRRPFVASTIVRWHSVQGRMLAKDHFRPFPPNTSKSPRIQKPLSVPYRDLRIDLDPITGTKWLVIDAATWKRSTKELTEGRTPKADLT